MRSAKELEQRRGRLFGSADEESLTQSSLVAFTFETASFNFRYASVYILHK